MLDFVLLPSSTLTSTKLHFLDFRSSVSPSRLALHLVQSQQLQLPVEILLLSKCLSKAEAKLELGSPGLESLIKDGLSGACRGEIAVMLEI